MEGGTATYPLVGRKIITARRKTALRLLWGIGFGVSGQVYAAEDLGTGQHLAVKVCRIQSDEEKQRRAEREVGRFALFPCFSCRLAQQAVCC